MLELRAGDIMIPLNEYPHILHWHTLRQALEAIRKVQIHVGERLSLARVALVFNDSYMLMGIVRRRDILRGLDPEFLSGILLAGNDRTTERNLVAGIRKNADRPVSDVMYPVQTTVDYNDNIVKIIDAMTAHSCTLIPVRKDGEVVGVVRTVEVCEAIGRLLQDESAGDTQ